MHFTTIRETKVAYRKDGSGPGLILVHGTGGDGEANWADVAADLREDFTIVRPDFSGSGATEDDGGPLTVDDLAAQVLATADDAGLARFSLCGFSLGAAVAARIAADHPDRVDALILIAGFLRCCPRLTMQFLLWRDLIATDRKSMARHILLTGFSPDALSSWGDEAIGQAVEDIVATQNWAGMARQTELDLTLDISDTPAKIAAPTLVVGTTHDHMVPASHGKAIAASIAGAAYAELPTGHLVPMERPDLTSATIRQFLKEGRTPEPSDM